MPFRFNRRIRILPGLRLNLSKSGVSTSIGGRGAWLTFGKRGVRTTVGLPGSGFSYTHLDKPAQHAAVPHVEAAEVTPTESATRGWLWIAGLFVIGAGLVLLIDGCSEKKVEPPKSQFVEMLKVAGQCSEDHVQQLDDYAGDIFHYVQPTTGLHSRLGFVTAADAMSDERIKQEVEDPARYSTPSTISFYGLSAEDITGTSLILHGISSPFLSDGSDKRAGYHSTCRLTVTERLDHPPSRAPHDDSAEKKRP